MKLKPARILLTTVTLGALCLVSEASWSAPTGHFDGGHFGEHLYAPFAGRVRHKLREGELVATGADIHD